MKFPIRCFWEWCTAQSTWMAHCGDVQGMASQPCLLQVLPWNAFPTGDVSCPFPFRQQLVTSFLLYNSISFGLYLKRLLIKSSLICSGRLPDFDSHILRVPSTRRVYQNIHTRPTCPLKEDVELLLLVVACGSLTPTRNASSICFRSVCWRSGMWRQCPQNENEPFQKAQKQLLRDQGPQGRNGPKAHGPRQC